MSYESLAQSFFEVAESINREAKVKAYCMIWKYVQGSLNCHSNILKNEAVQTLS